MMKDPSSQQELSQPKTWQVMTDESYYSSQGDTNKNISFEVS